MKNINGKTAGISILSVSLILFIFFMTSFKMKAAEPSGRQVKVVSLCFQNQDFNRIIEIVDAESSKGADFIVLPETWRGQTKAETLEGETITALAALAKKHNTYILSPIDRKDGNLRLNSAVLIDRKGKVVWIYDKIYPYWSEFDLDPPVDPAKNGKMVFDTDFGRIGVAICFDANFPEVWQALNEQGAEVVFWSSAYSAGSQLQAYSLLYHYYIVTSTYTRDCQVYDITGQRILDESSGEITVARITLDLDRGIYHENFNMDKLGKLLKEHRDEVEREIHLTREQWFILRATKAGVSARQLAKEYGLEELSDYQNRSRKEINNKRGFGFAEKFTDKQNYGRR